MNATSLSSSWATRIAGVGVALTLTGAGVGGALWRQAIRLDDQPSPGGPTEPRGGAWPASPDASVFQSVPWQVFAGQTVRAASNRLTARFRLAGTFLVYHGDLTDSRRAILDDLSSRVQVIVSEGERILDGTVVRIYRDRLVARFPDGEEDLWLGADRAGAGGNSAQPDPGTQAIEAAQAAEEDRFGGKRTGENRWEYKRDRLLSYYAELRDEPERLLSVFDSLKPIYDADRRITGYHLDVTGEADFFQSVGLKQGDSVRAVNSMPMTNRKRAEYFISEFINDRASAFVLDIERDGQRQKLVYEIR